MTRLRKIVAVVAFGTFIFAAGPVAAGEAEAWNAYERRIDGIMRELHGGLADLNAHARGYYARNPGRGGWTMAEMLDPEDVQERRRDELLPPENPGRHRVVKSYCDGVGRDTIGRFGYTLPGWGRSILTACSYVDELAANNYFSAWKSTFKNNCKQMEKDAKSFMKAKPVAVNSRVQEKTVHLGTDIYFYWQALCKHKVVSVNRYHPEFYGQ